MSRELINRITVKKDGVYLSTHSSNDSAPYYSHRNDRLSDIYAAEGRKGLDREVIRLLYEYAELRGRHKSLDRYRYAKDAPEALAIYKQYTDQIDDRYEQMDQADQDSVWYKPTEKARAFNAYERRMRDEMYSVIAARCEEYEKNQKSRELER